jgi:hypothetical protein
LIAAVLTQLTLCGIEAAGDVDVKYWRILGGGLWLLGLLTLTPLGRLVSSISLWLRLLPGVLGLRALAMTLEKTREPRLLRIAAFILFIVGSQLDLLNS